MKSPLNHDESWAYRSALLLSVLALAVGLWGRLRHIVYPPQFIWDEIYFPVMASKYLRGVEFFDLHPPLGKFIIASGIALFGDTPLGWRITPAIFGCALLPLGAALGWYLFRERVGAVLLAAFFAGETVLIAHSRTGVMESSLLFFTLATFLSALLARRPRHVIWTAVLLGLSISIKWAVLPVMVPAGYVLWRKGLLRPFIGGLYLSAVIYLAIVFVGQILNPTGASALHRPPGEEGAVFVDANPWVLVWDWHLGALHQAGERVPHVWGSPWWSWPLMLRPIRYFLDPNEADGLRMIYAIGNPVLWWSSTVAVLAGLVEVARRLILRKPVADDPIVPIVLGYVLLLLPWVPGTRIPYIYNYLAPYAFALLALVYWLCRLWRVRPWGPWAAVGFLGLAIATAAFFLPMATGAPMDPGALEWRIWFDSWHYPQDPVPGSSCTPPHPDPRCF